MTKKTAGPKNRYSPPVRAIQSVLAGPPTKIWRSLARGRQASPIKSFKLSPGIRSSGESARPPKLPGSTRLLLESAVFFKRHFKLFGGLSAIYVLAQWLVRGVPQPSLAPDVTSQSPASVAAGTLGGLLNPPLSDLQQFLSSFLILLFAMSLIWAARYATAGKKVTVRQALYNSPRPLVPVILIIIVMTLQALPSLLGLLILSYTLGQSGGLSGVEAMMFALAAGLLIILSVYFLLQSFMALVIATLPNTYPVAALKEARRLVMGRRLIMLLRLLAAAAWFAALWLAVAFSLWLLDYKFGWVSPVTSVLLGVIDGLGLSLATIYFYKLYRRLI